jgi:hypothetical protein
LNQNSEIYLVTIVIIMFLFFFGNVAHEGEKQTDRGWIDRSIDQSRRSKREIEAGSRRSKQAIGAGDRSR